MSLTYDAKFGGTFVEMSEASDGCSTVSTLCLSEKLCAILDSKRILSEFYEMSGPAENRENRAF